MIQDCHRMSIVAPAVATAATLQAATPCCHCCYCCHYSSSGSSAGRDGMGACGGAAVVVAGGVGSGIGGRALITCVHPI